MARSVSIQGGPKRRVAVVGGGWAGMSAAVELATHGIPVTVFESARTLGGRARRVAVDDHTLDNGLHILIGAYSETLRLINKVTAPAQAANLLRLPLRLTVKPGFDLRASRLPAPLHMVTALLFARGLGFADKFAAMRFVNVQKSARFQCDAGITVQALLRASRQSAHLIDYLWGPLCVSALNTSPEQADAQVFLNVLRDTFTGQCSVSDLLLPKVDFSALFPDPAAIFVKDNGGEIRSGDSVSSLRVLDDGIEIAASTTATYSHCIIAVGPHHLEKLAVGVEQLAQQVEMIRLFEYRPIYSVFLQYSPRVKLPEPMIGFRNGLAQWVFDRGELCNQQGMLGVVISASGSHQQLSQDELAMRVHHELAQHFNLPEPLWSQVIAEKRATFACTPNLRRPKNRTALPNLFLAGDYTESPYPATLESAVRSGHACARHVIDGDT